MRRYAGKNAWAANYLRAALFDYPEWTPCAVNFLPATWLRHGAGLEDLVLRHPRIFPSFRRGTVDLAQKAMCNPLYETGRHTDCWGTVWNNIARGFDSQPESHPLEDWAALPGWKRKLPDPLKDDLFGPRRPWAEVRRDMDAARARGDIVWGGGLPHGFFFMRLYYLRGFENLMLDFACEDPRLEEVIAIVRDYSVAVTRKYLEMDCDIMGFGEDLGMQTALPISTATWRKYVKPTYEAVFGLCRDRDVPVYLHSDGHILEIIPDLIETGVRIINPQIRANGLEGLKEVALGKVAVNLDLDRQLFPFATPDQIEAHVEEVFRGLYLRRGGLMLQAECGPDVSLEGIEAICRAMERLCRPPCVRHPQS